MGVVWTGYYVRIRRDGGRMESVDLGDMTPAEVDRFIADRRAKGEDGWPWVRAILAWLQANVEEGPPPRRGRVGPRQ